MIDEASHKVCIKVKAKGERSGMKRSPKAE
jgi:hypothetical protein